jgi:RAT1-interacting protein
LRYYYPPRLPADLNKGFDTFEQLNDSGDQHLDALLETVIALEKETGSKCEADIITWRGMMTKVGDESVEDLDAPQAELFLKILTTPFDNMNGYSFSPVTGSIVILRTY